MTKSGGRLPERDLTIESYWPNTQLYTCLLKGILLVSSRMAITVIGSLNYDLVTYTDRIPHAGETFRANSFETHAGGKGLNQTIALAKLRHPDTEYTVRMIGKVGEDSFGEQLLNVLQNNKVDVSDVQAIENESTGTATIIVEELNGGQNRILLTEGANGKTVYSEGELTSVFKKINSKDFKDLRHLVVLQHEIPEPGSIILWLKRNNPKFEIVFNPSPFKPLQKDVWNSIDILIVNELEALQIIESLYSSDEYKKYQNIIEHDFLNGYRNICEELKENIVCQSKKNGVIITLGAKGALYASKNCTVSHVPCMDGIKVVDTTGAGDTFLGALITQLYQGGSLGEAVKFSTMASSVAIQRRGAAESIPHYTEVDALIQEEC